MPRPGALLATLFTSVWLHGGLMTLLWLLTPWLELMVPEAVAEAAAEGPMSVSVELVDGDATESAEASPDTKPLTMVDVDAPAASERASEPASDKGPPKADPKHWDVPANYAEKNEGADQPQAKGATPEKKPCPVADEITQTAAAKWAVERELIDYYAGHVGEMNKLGSTWAHKGPDGKPDGFRIRLPRCSVLRQGGLRSGDVVRQINGIRINSLIQAIGAWFQLRNETDLRVQVVRGGNVMQLAYEIEPREKRRKRKR